MSSIPPSVLHERIWGDSSKQIYATGYAWGQLTNTVRIRIGKIISELSNGVSQLLKGLLRLIRSPQEIISTVLRVNTFVTY